MESGVILVRKITIFIYEPVLFIKISIFFDIEKRDEKSF